MSGDQQSTRSRLDRREFLQATGAAALGLALGGLARGADRLPRRTLGRTGLEVSVIGLGACDDARVIDRALDLGINILHTSAGYKQGRCAQAVGEVLRRRRAEVIVAIQQKPGDGKLDDTLRQLQTDHVDLVVPPLPPYSNYDGPLLEAFEQQRQAGKVRFLGYAAHEKMAGVINCRAAAPWSAALVHYNLGTRAELEPVMRHAAEQAKIGFLAMKGTRGLDKADPKAWQAGLRLLLTNPALASIVIGGPSVQQLEQNVAAVLQSDARADAAFGRYAAATADRACGFCGACQQACPRQVALLDYRRAELYADRGDHDLAGELLASIPAGQTSAACATGCDHCRQACPRRLDVRECLPA